MNKKKVTKKTTNAKEFQKKVESKELPQMPTDSTAVENVEEQVSAEVAKTKVESKELPQMPTDSTAVENVEEQVSAEVAKTKVEMEVKDDVLTFNRNAGSGCSFLLSLKNKKTNVTENFYTEKITDKILKDFEIKSLRKIKKSEKLAFVKNI